MLESFEPNARFVQDVWQHAAGGGGKTRVIENGAAFERVAVNFSHLQGTALPPAATQKRPELSGRAYRVMGVSLIAHPQNPYVPTVHMNVRYFEAGDIRWFGGGFDLTPYYGFEEDARTFHAAAKIAAGADYPAFKKACDDYFFNKHRQEPRGIGGIFFDDQDDFALIERTGAELEKAYRQIVARRIALPFGQREREFQLYRRGRYVEFNLVHDRGTLFGLQSNGRVESILCSLPPLVSWRYDYKPAPGSPEAELSENFLVPKDWV